VLWSWELKSVVKVQIHYRYLSVSSEQNSLRRQRVSHVRET